MREEAGKQREHELALASVKTDESNPPSVQGSLPGLKLPRFQEGKDEIDDFLRRFERIAATQKWDRSSYHLYLSSLLSGKALKIYVSLSDSILEDYDSLKEGLLKAYAVDADFYRKRFRESKVKDNETYVQLATRMRQDFNHWMSLDNVEKDYESVCDFMVRDQLLYNCPYDLRLFLKERTFENTLAMTQAADRFRSAHRSTKPRVQSEGASSSKSQLKCHQCQRTGHSRPNCPDLNKSSSKAGPTKKIVHNIFTTEGFPQSSDTCKGEVFGEQAKFFYDTGCNGVLIKDSLVPKTAKRSKIVQAYDFTGFCRDYPLVRCYVKSKFLTGWVNAIVAPLKYCDVIIGKVPGVTLPSNQAENESLAESVPEAKVMVIQTRAQKKSAQLHSQLSVPDSPAINFSSSDLVAAQTSCPTLDKIRRQASQQSTITVKHRTVMYEYINDLIYRVCLTSKNDHEAGMKQLVVPQSMRQVVMTTAHDSALAGHFSHRKTAEKVFREFFWPGAGADIKRFCRSCHVCQKTSPKGNVRKAPLVSMPINREPFSRVAIDLVGPLTPSSEGHRYILTLIDCATRFPEAVPLKNIDTVTIAESLVSIFSRVGIPKEMLSDRGTQFKSDLMAEVNRLLSIKAIFTSPYHACCNGMVERFHAVLKAMLKKLCLDKPSDWHRYLPSVLFAYREIPNDTLKFSPFELLYGHRVRGPLSILHDLWTNTDLSDEVKTTYQYVLDLRSRLEDSASIASANAAVNSKMYKTYFDRNTQSRVLSEEDEVLVLLPSSHNKLKMQYKGPYSVVKCH